MSTRFDILDRKQALKDHMNEHKCGELTTCETRSALRRDYFDTAGKWGLEYGDDERQREQFNARVATGSTS